MLQYMRRIAEIKRREDGASAVEYGLLVAAIAALIVLVVFALGGLVRDRFQETCDAIAAEPVAGGAAGDCNTAGTGGTG